MGLSRHPGFGQLPDPGTGVGSSIGMLRKEVWISGAPIRVWRSSSTICSRSVDFTSGNPAMTFLIFYTSLYYKLGQDNEDSKVVYDRIQRMLSKAGDLSFS